MTGWTWRSMGGGTCLAGSLDWRERGTPDRRDSLRASRLCRVRFCWWRANSRACRWCIERRIRDIEDQAQTALGERQRAQRRLDALRRIGRAVDEAGLYERVLIPGHCLSNDLFRSISG